jgi:hypothetical protein
MRADVDDLPVLGRAFSTLGVQISGPYADVRVLDDGTITPGTGGMSVFIDPRKMPKSLRPRTLAEKPGESPHPVFKLEESELPHALRFRKDKDYHGLVESQVQCKLEEYEDQLGATRTQWKVAYAAR